jgi:hypothetical protein
MTYDQAPYNGTLIKVPLAGGAPITLASGLRQPRSLVIDAMSVYWLDFAPSPAAFDGDYVEGTVMRLTPK